MKIRIYQVNTDRDEKRAAFAGTDTLPVSDVGEPVVDSGIYDCVFEGEVACKSLEEVYRMFNINPHEGYRARSLSVSDVVEVTESEKPEKGFYYCNTFGFYKVDFDPTKAQIGDRFLKIETPNKITVLLVEPNKRPKFTEIEDTLEAMRELIGGDIEEYMPFEDEVAIICDEEGKLKGLPPNRAVYGINDDGERQMLDVIRGKFFLCYAPIASEKFQSLPKDLALKYERMFHDPETFRRSAAGIEAVPFKPKSKEPER